MTDRSDLVREIQAARNDGPRLTRAVAALDAFDTGRIAVTAAARETDLGAEIVAHRMAPRTAHEMHTAATDWLDDFRDPGEGDFRTAMVSEAMTWYRGLDAAVRQDGEELGLQARGRAHTLASAYGSKARDAAREFLSYVGYLHQGASGLPQIDQTVDANNAPSQTPYPTEVFPTFGEEQDPFNAGIEDNNHGSQVSSDHAPLIQQVEQQNSSGSGFGSGPERPDQHSTGMDTADSYAEVPLGPPGQIPTAPAATDGQAASTPNPVAGKPQDAGADRRHASVEGYSMPDPFGYRWLTTGEVMHPFHEKCASAHWPEESCGAGAEHTASVAVGYAMDMDTARRLARCEETGAQEGRRAIAAAATPDALAARHNAVTAGWGATERTAEDTAVLHGFMAVVRPVLAVGLEREADYKYIHERDGKWVITQKGTGKVLSEHDSEEKAKASFRAMMESKHGSAWDRGRLDFPEAPVGGSRREAKVPSPACPQCHSTSVKLGRKDDENTITCSDCGHSQSYGQTTEIMRHESASALPQVQQVTDANNQETPQADDLPEGVAFPVNPAWSQRWTTGPQGAVPAGGQATAAGLTGLPETHARMFGHMDALDGKKPQHKDDFTWSARAHGTYLKAFNNVHAATYDGEPMTRDSYGDMTGRPDLFPHWQDARDSAQRARNVRATAGARTASDSGTGSSAEEPHCTSCGHKPGCDCPHNCTYPGAEKLDEHQRRTARQVQADTYSQPHQTTDDQNAPFNTPATAPDPASSNAMPQDADYSAGAAAGRADRAAGERPAFADNSSGVSPYVKGYAAEYGAAQGPSGPQDVPASMGGDNGQGLLDQEAQKAQLVARGSRLSDAFVPAELHSNADFRKGYGFASAWAPAVALVSTGSAAFEAGLYAGITDRPGVQDRWLAAHALHAQDHPELTRRVALHQSFSQKTAAAAGLRVQGAYLARQAADDGYTVSDLQDAQAAGLLRDDERLSEIAPDRARELARQVRQRRTAGTSTDLISDGPGSSPDPMGATPLNGPGQPPPMGGLDEAATPGGSPPYQGAPPLPGGPVVPDDVMGKPQRPEQKDGPFTNTFSGEHQENVTLAPVAPVPPQGPGYSNRDSYAGDPHGGDRMAAFRQRVQASLAGGLGADLIEREAAS